MIFTLSAPSSDSKQRSSLRRRWRANDQHFINVQVFDGSLCPANESEKKPISERVCAWIHNLGVMSQISGVGSKLNERRPVRAAI